MALDIRKLARKQTVMAEIMELREKGDTEELINFGKPVTINDCELCEITKEDGSVEQVWAYTVKEFKDKFFFAGFVLAKIFNSFVEGAEGDFDEVYDTVRKEGLMVMFGTKKTRDNKRTVTTVEVI